MSTRISRRRLLGIGAGVTGAAVTGAVLATHLPRADADAGAEEPFHGEHQAGIATPAQDRLVFAAFDVVTSDRGELREMLREWTAAAAAMAAGRAVPGGSTNPLAPPADTGEALGLPAAHLTVTLGFGPTLFDGRFGLAAYRPAALAELPALPGDQLERARSGGDLGVQACANDPVVAFHAVRNLARLGRGTVVVRWSQLGFGRTSSTSRSQATPRNLMGFKDGTRNVVGEDAAAMDAHVWVGDETDQSWMRGGSYLVARRIRMLIEAWDRSSLRDQQDTIGRLKTSGAPLTGRAEHDVPDFVAATHGSPVIPANAHIRLASPEENDGIRILRRGYSYTDGMDPVTGQLDAGLFFLAYQKDPRTQFVALQRRLGVHDALGEYIEHTGSALFACPPGVAPGQAWGEALFA
ncbi:MAG TPA: iron uptake transporter deferrochelatase/peroxidase subunit [Actinomycetes bacterium]|nr:iron uptake transporter deferrochelatase/peroxidase subunit [Actinomycetes bacterium]